MTSLDEVVLFGGRDVHGDYLGDTWTWRNGCWSFMRPANSPSPRADLAVAYDAGRGLVLIYGLYITNTGSGTDMWTWDGTNWTSVNNPDGPDIRRHGGAVATFDEASGQVVMTADVLQSRLLQTWIWHGSRWQQMATKSAPIARFEANMSFDPVTRKVLLYGGWNSYGPSILGDTWTWDGAQWTELSPAASPPARAGAAMASFAAKHQVILVGGIATEPFDEAWTWDGMIWSPAPSPGLRQEASAVDIGSRVLIFGGTLGQDPLTWDGTRWSRP